MVGYALGTLTHQEHRELLQLAIDNPQLMLDAVRLRHMSAVQIAQKVDWPTEGFEVGAEGWADTATRSLRLALPEPIASELNEVSPAPDCALSDVSSYGSNDREHRQLNPHLNPHHLGDSPVELPKPDQVSEAPSDRMRRSSAIWRLFFRKGIWRWIMVLGLILFGIDYWRVRQLLAITQGKVLQLEKAIYQRPEAIDWRSLEGQSRVRVGSVKVKASKIDRER